MSPAAAGAADLVEVLVGQDDLLDEWYAVYITALQHHRPYCCAWQRGEIAADLASTSVQVTRLLLGRAEGRAVCAGWIQLPMTDRADTASVEVAVLPEEQRRGYGSVVLECLLDLAREAGRTLVEAEASFPYEAAADGAGEAGPEFLRHHGFTFGLGDVQRVLALPVADALLAELAVEAGPHHAAYRLRSMVGAIPDDLVESFVALESRLSVEAPMGELTREPTTSNVSAYRDRETLMVEQHRTKVSTVALAADGTVAAYTDVGIPFEEPGRCYQWGTLVAREHRGHRLGLAVKAANIALLQREFPDRHTLVTYNAEVNSHMIGINERFGFRPVERLGELQRRLG